MTAPAPDRQQPSARELQQRGAAVLALLLTFNLPAVLWTVRTGTLPGYGTEPYATNPLVFPLLEGQTFAHSAVRAWAGHLGTEAGIDYDTTPSVCAVVDGIGVRIWCAPRYRDDIDARAEQGGA